MNKKAPTKSIAKLLDWIEETELTHLESPSVIRKHFDIVLNWIMEQKNDKKIHKN